MTRAFFYKKYYELTNKIYADRTIWFAKNREYERRKGRISTSKTERAVFIMAQYFVLIATGIISIVRHNGVIVIGCIYSLLTSLITDFSILKIEILYHLFSLRNPYASLLQKDFLGTIDDFWCPIKSNTKKTVSGFVRTNISKFVAKYDVVFRKKKAPVTIIIRPFRIVIKSADQTIVLKDPKATESQIATDISEILHPM